MSLFTARTYIGSAMLVAALGLLASHPAGAVTMQECSAKYKDAQTAGKLGGMTWQQFRKTNCSAKASTNPTTAAPAAPRAATKSAAAKAAVKNATFPAAVSPKYASESAGKARMHTCLDQYKVNKASNANGGLRWIEKGGGYFSECNKRLKG